MIFNKNTNNNENDNQWWEKEFKRSRVVNSTTTTLSLSLSLFLSLSLSLSSRKTGTHSFHIGYQLSNGPRVAGAPGKLNFGILTNIIFEHFHKERNWKCRMLRVKAINYIILQYKSGTLGDVYKMTVLEISMSLLLPPWWSPLAHGAPGDWPSCLYLEPTQDVIAAPLIGSLVSFQVHQWGDHSFPPRSLGIMISY